MSYVVSIGIVDRDCDQLSAVPPHAVIFIVNRSNPRRQLLTRKEH